MLGRVSLIGYRASGKSTVAPLVAAALGWRWLDADRELELREGRSIRELLQEGEAVLRSVEIACLSELLSADENKGLVLATGGGAVLRPENRSLLAQRGGLVVYLAAGASLLQERLRRQAGGRPSLTGSGVAEEVPLLLAQREPLYRSCARLVLDAAEAPQELAQRIARTVRMQLEAQT